MIETQITIVNKLGLHARAAAKLVGCTSALSSSIDADRALALGLIDRVVADGDQLERALRAAIKQALRCKPEAINGLKRLSERIAGMPLAGAVHVGAAATTDLLASPETINALKAFLEGEPLPWFDRYRPAKE